MLGNQHTQSAMLQTKSTAEEKGTGVGADKHIVSNSFIVFSLSFLQMWGYIYGKIDTVEIPPLSRVI